VIARRLTAIRSADRILVLSEQGIAEEGSHEELLNRNGIYGKVCRLQLGQAAE
jgi:ATP-binding cassette subfamily B protein